VQGPPLRRGTIRSLRSYYFLFISLRLNAL